MKNTRAPVLVLCLGALGCRADLPLEVDCILTERMRTFVASHQSCHYSSECALIAWGCSGASVRREFVTAFDDKFAFARALIPRRTCCGSGPVPLEATCRVGHCIPVK